jgi:cellulose biosynthesis protein BcsQ
LLEDFLTESFFSEHPNLHEYVRPVMPDQKSGILGTSDTLAYTETSLAMRWRLRENRKDVRLLLRKQLHQRNVTHKYDLILLDCPPLINVCCINALAASDYLLIPTMPSRNATWRVPVLLSRINEFVANLNPRLKVMGVVPNRTFGSELTIDEQNLLNAMRDQCLNDWHQHIPILSPHIPRNVAFRHSEDAKRPLQAEDPIFARYIQLACEIQSLMPFFCKAVASPTFTHEAVS